MSNESHEERSGPTFEQIHREHHAEVYDLILRFVGDSDTAEDLTVETFLNAYRAWDRFRDRDIRVSTWLHQIAVENCKAHFMAAPRSVPPERERLRRAAVDALPLEYKRVLTLAEEENKSYDEIAAITGLTVAAVKARLRQARDLIRRYLFEAAPPPIDEKEN